MPSYRTQSTTPPPTVLKIKKEKKKKTVKFIGFETGDVNGVINFRFKGDGEGVLRDGVG